MVINFIIDKFPSLSETFILNQITGMIDLGHKVNIFAWGKSGETIMHEDVLKYNLMESTIYYRDIVPDSKIYRIMKAIKVIFNGLLNNYKIILNALNIIKYGRKALNLELLLLASHFKKADVLLCHFGPNGKVGALIKQVGIKAKIVTIFHGYDMTTYIEKNDKGIYSELFKYGDLFLPVCNYWRQKLIMIGCDEKKIKVHHMGIDIKRHKYEVKAINNIEVIKLLTVGRLIKKKGHEYFLHALVDVINKHKNIEYKIAGDGPLRTYLEDMVNRLGISNNVIFTGPVSQEKVIGLYSESHIFVLPSISEGLPVVLMEAHANGMPVVATEISGIPEITIDGESGFLVPAANEIMLKEKVLILINNCKYWQRMGVEGRRIVEKEFNIEIQNKRLEGLIKNLLRV